MSNPVSPPSPQEGHELSFGAGPIGRLLFWIAVVFSVFQIVTAAHLVDLSSQVTRALHVGFLTLLAFPLIAYGRNMSAPLRALAWAFALAGVAVALYQWWEYQPLILRAGRPLTQDIIVGVVALVVVFAAAWTMMGFALPLIAGLFLAYCLFGEYLPAPLNHRGYDFSQVIDHMAYGTEGIYGIPTYVSSTYIFLFILFGSFLERAGMIRLFTDVALGLFGQRQGGAAKVAVVSSGLMGTISGSGVANVVTTGQFTIPLMKKFGYRPAFAGGVEATASMGGQIMPPVMGAVAFIMAETLDVAYVEVVKAALIPAMLYFASAFWMVHLEAGRHGLRGLSKEDLPSARKAIRENWMLLVPLGVLVYLLFGGYTPLFAGTIGLGLTVLLILGGSAVLNLPAGAMRVVFWMCLGLVAAGFLQFGINVLIAALVTLVLWCALSRGGRDTLILCRDSLAEGAKTALPVGVACALVGIIIGTMTLTGAANTFGQFIVAVGQSSLLLSLILTMFTCILLGMGIPTIPNYIITSSIAGPALLELGVPLIVSHMFVFYFGILADLTPPVALACFAAAPIAKESGLRISLEAIKVAAAGFVIPFMAVYTPALMLQAGGPLAETIGYWPAVAYIVFKTVLCIGMWGAAVIGWLGRPLGWPLRILGIVAAATLIAALPATDEIGFALAALFVGGVVVMRRRAVA
ncbi:TRAP transporter permease [Pseudosulfitobacter pseudonitzschiae]|uniref:TRAP transporter permease n=1 Tax=Pseudosulfitobacter pseudonitzschiae TaxID=1402135 RepID=UPI001AFCB495|nr:TRAP transporter permease [Pseudosulfitobacter pseudonitzschiae]MBM1817976.1 TRAP transporter permease [Pseudosulfitobacter pseudonitzschiae]MBM1835034.1 TRAP transporter permease [Pseudosulfitobacter pseudonitzschiae]MBM1839835.1 TRAP transporter permease [Pseudosulfitobacter pseudonitzschiae]MBM1844749.1 TRAP transporter permease [Pseudosulfitobacter pseudonitzschiae]MBM1849552.1 TRAP transporter permease [Pseudosulfitobacter pseudonitzschiae]